MSVVAESGSCVLRRLGLRSTTERNNSWHRCRQEHSVTNRIGQLENVSRITQGVEKMEGLGEDD